MAKPAANNNNMLHPNATGDVRMSKIMLLMQHMYSHKYASGQDAIAVEALCLSIYGVHEA